MVTEKIKVSEIIKDGVSMTTYSDGSQHFESIETHDDELKRKSLDNRNWLGRLKDWWNNLNVKPYVRTKDLNNGKDTNGENKPKNAIEIGIKGTF